MKKKQAFVKNINSVHLQLYKNLKKKALSLEFGHTNELKEYSLYQKKLERRPFKTITSTSFVKKLKQAGIIYLGDFHTFDQSSRNFERLLREFLNPSQKDIPLSIGLEMIDIRDQIHVDAYIGSHITEKEFLESINFEKKWQFPWNQYRGIFEFAKKNKLPVFALNSSGSIERRDLRAAKVIARQRAEHPNSRIFIFFGELHILPSNLPLKVSNILEKEEHLIIHQNLDQVYWKLARKKAAPFFQHDQIIQFNNREFALLSAVPWIKYESMIYWHETDSSDTDSILYEGQLSRMAKNLGDNAYDNFLSFSKEVIKALSLPDIEMAEIENFALHDQFQLKLVMNKIKKLKSPDLEKFYSGLITKGHLFRVPSIQLYYCPNYSINRLNMLIGIHLRYVVLYTKFSGIKKNSLDMVNLISGDKIEIFSQFLLDEACAYYVSKIINPFRKCDHLPEIKKKSINSTGHLLALKLLKVKSPKSLITLLKSKNRLELQRLARIIGPLYGHLLVSLKERPEASEEMSGLLAKLFSRLYLGPEELVDTLKFLVESDISHGKKRLF
jgi:hypothetical protein